MTDVQQSGKTKHILLVVIVMTICAVISERDVWEGIVDFCRVKEKWFMDSLNMKLGNGIPSRHDAVHMGDDSAGGV